MSKVVRTAKPGRRGRGGRTLARLGMLGAAALVGRKTATRQQPRANGGGLPNAVPAAPDTESPGVGANGSWAGHSPEPPASDSRGRGAERPQDIPRQGWRDIAIRVKNQVRDDKVPLLSAGVAFYAMLSLFPAVIALVSIYGLVAEPDTVRAQVDDLATIIPEGARKLLTDQLTALTSTAGGKLSLGVALGILTALWSASSGMNALITGSTSPTTSPSRASSSSSGGSPSCSRSAPSSPWRSRWA